VSKSQEEGVYKRPKMRDNFATNISVRLFFNIEILEVTQLAFSCLPTLFSSNHCANGSRNLTLNHTSQPSPPP